MYVLLNNRRSINNIIRIALAVLNISAKPFEVYFSK